MKPGIEKTLQLADGKLFLVETRTVELAERSIDGLMLVKEVVALGLQSRESVTLFDVARKCEPMPLRWVEDYLDSLCDDLGCFEMDASGAITKPKRRGRE